MSNVLPVIGIDIGSSYIRGIVAEVSEQKEVAVSATASFVSAGLFKGSSPKELFLAIQQVVSELVSQYGRRVTDVIVSFPVEGVGFVRNTGFLTSSSETGRVTEQDRQDCVRKAKQVMKPSDCSILHVLPSMYFVDAVPTTHPVGTEGSHLEVDCLIVYGKTTSITAVSQVFRDMGLHMVGLVYDPLAEGQVVLTQGERSLGAIVLHVGGRFSRVSVFQNHQLVWSCVLPMGGDTMTSDISIVLDVTFPEAERLKIGYADVSGAPSDPCASRLVITKKSGDRQHVDRSYLSAIAHARADELVTLLMAKLPTQYKALPLIVSGGGSGVSGFEALVCKYSPTFTRSGAPSQLGLAVKDTRFLTSVGLVFYGLSVGAVAIPSSSPDSFWKKILKMI